MSEARVLLVDDDEALGDALSDALQQYGFDVTLARDWTSALTALERANPQVLVLDQRLGRVDWPAASLVDTEIRFSNRIGGPHAAAGIQSGVQS
ncbi:response regulator [Rhodovarius lipocyclicus]|uniref:response regulator n=1 Tax=Rhodovarius lipocyclicus TaxID=268410 RepID=UPI001359928D|nr:response regulator [Rhodovarius lipocyclicus]